MFVVVGVIGGVGSGVLVNDGVILGEIVLVGVTDGGKPAVLDGVVEVVTDGVGAGVSVFVGVIDGVILIVGVFEGVSDGGKPVVGVIDGVTLIVGLGVVPIEQTSIVSTSPIESNVNT